MGNRVSWVSALMGNRGAKEDPSKETATQKLSRLYGLDGGGGGGSDGDDDDDDDAAPTWKIKQPQTRYSQLSAAPLTVTTVKPEENNHKRQMGAKIGGGGKNKTTSSGESPNQTSDHSLKTGSSRSEMNSLVEEKNKKHGAHEDKSKDEHHHKFAQSKDNSGGNVRHVTFGGAWEVSEAPSQASVAPGERKGGFKRGQLKKTTVQMTAVNQRGIGRLGELAQSQTIFMKHDEK